MIIVPYGSIGMQQPTHTQSEKKSSKTIYPEQGQNVYWYPLLLQLQVNFVMEQVNVVILKSDDIHYYQKGWEPECAR